MGLLEQLGYQAREQTGLLEYHNDRKINAQPGIGMIQADQRLQRGFVDLRYNLNTRYLLLQACTVAHLASD